MLPTREEINKMLEKTAVSEPVKRITLLREVFDKANKITKTARLEWLLKQRTLELQIETLSETAKTLGMEITEEVKKTEGSHYQSWFSEQYPQYEEMRKKLGPELCELLGKV